MSRVVWIVALVMAAVLGVVSGGALWWYLFDVLIGQAGEPDRSMVFWGLPILFIGISAGAGAIGLAIVAYRSLAAARRQPS